MLDSVRIHEAMNTTFMISTILWDTYFKRPMVCIAPNPSLVSTQF